ncbi:MAG: BREX-2 system phosphatase PglZ, partial [Gaiellaceae bacterium]
ALTVARLADAERAFEDIADHEYAALDPGRVAPARMAVRLLCWLEMVSREQPGGALPQTVAAGVDGHLGDWGWVDRALITLRAGDPVHDDAIATAYKTVARRAQTRRDEFDHAFALRLAAWAPDAAPSAGLLRIEDVLERVVAPIADSAPSAPLLLVLDGMSSAAAVDLAEQIRGDGWIEASIAPGRKAALAMFPSVTRISRASLLAGAPNTGGQQAETDAFEAFWQRRRRPAALFHKSDIAGPDGARLANPLVRALSETGTVVGVVLNTIDDALDKDRMGDRTGWRVADITHLDVLLDSARSYGRPIVVVSDHGHVLERGTEQQDRPSAAAARWRTGEPAEGEIALTGSRVLDGGGNIVVPWRDDIRYAQKRAGYHGGASLAEMTVPVLAFMPRHDDPPSGWHVLPEEDTTPPWWTRAAGPAASATIAAPAQPAKGRATAKRPSVPPVQEDALFAAPAAATVPAVVSPTTHTSLGIRVVDSPVYRRQLAMVRRQPKAERVVAVIDALAAAGGSLSSTKTIEVMGSTAARLEGTFATLQRLLNVETYPVLMLVDGGRTARLDVLLLSEQFGV